MDLKNLYCQSIGWWKVRQGIFSASCGSVNKHQQDRPCWAYCNVRRVPANNFCSRKSIRITYSKSVFIALGTQSKIRMSRIIFSSVTCPAVLQFSTLSHKLQNLRKKNIYLTWKLGFDLSEFFFFKNIYYYKKN
jgi:hypothetical protein